MITLIIVLCIVISVAIICYTYYKIRELKECLVSDSTDSTETLEIILRLINKYDKMINDDALTNNVKFIKLDSILTFIEMIRGFIDTKLNGYDED